MKFNLKDKDRIFLSIVLSIMVVIVVYVSKTPLMSVFEIIQGFVFACVVFWIVLVLYDHVGSRSNR